jgi:hypothetical protein
MFWLNADKTTNIYKLHRVSCRYGKPRETEYKGVDKMKRNGGWFKFASFEDAYRFYTRKKINAIWQPCRVCNPEK